MRSPGNFGIRTKRPLGSPNIRELAVKQKDWNEAENRERDWGETLKFFRACEARALRARKTLTPRSTDLFTDFEKKTDCFAV